MSGNELLPPTHELKPQTEQDDYFHLLARVEVNMHHILTTLNGEVSGYVELIGRIMSDRTNETGEVRLTPEKAAQILGYLLSIKTNVLNRTRQAETLAQLPPRAIYGVAVGAITQEEADEMLRGH